VVGNGPIKAPLPAGFVLSCVVMAYRSERKLQLFRELGRMLVELRPLTEKTLTDSDLKNLKEKVSQMQTIMREIERVEPAKPAATRN